MPTDAKRFWCSTCGMVRTSDEAPFCRHAAPEMVATRMRSLPSWHPLVTAPSQPEPPEESTT